MMNLLKSYHNKMHFTIFYSTMCTCTQTCPWKLYATRNLPPTLTHQEVFSRDFIADRSEMAMVSCELFCQLVVCQGQPRRPFGEI